MSIPLTRWMPRRRNCPPKLPQGVRCPVFQIYGVGWFCSWRSKLDTDQYFRRVSGQYFRRVSRLFPLVFGPSLCIYLFAYAISWRAHTHTSDTPTHHLHTLEQRRSPSELARKKHAHRTLTTEEHRITRRVDDGSTNRFLYSYLNYKTF